MNIAMIGTGYVGLVTGSCLAESGNDVTCVDVDRSKIERLQKGEIPIYEPGLAELVKYNSRAGRLKFTTSAAEAVSPAQCVFIAVGTPQNEDGSANLTVLWTVVDSLAPLLGPETIVVIKSTVPVGTNRAVRERLCKLTGREVDVASNPEFLKEGCAIDDFTKPDRVVVGVTRPEVGEVLHGLYKPFLRTEHPFLVMGLESAEMTKYVANCLLAAKISFINEMANLSERLGADINDVRRGIGHDQRIGFSFLFPGAGYGGSCFPKDVRALIDAAERHKLDARILKAIDLVNDHQKHVLFQKIAGRFGRDLKGRTIAVWGLSFKPRTDDIREAPALDVIVQLRAAGASVAGYDPIAADNVRALLGDAIALVDDPYTAAEGADAIVLITEWHQLRQPDFARLRKLVRTPLLFDGRNVWDPVAAQRAGFEYHGIGRPRPES